jgi:hypothetical protein
MLVNKSDGATVVVLFECLSRDGGRLRLERWDHDDGRRPVDVLWYEGEVVWRSEDGW